MHLQESERAVCERPPSGWNCTREAGHDGPCAAAAIESKRCSWCGHVHDPEDGRCDAHAHVGVGRCPCPGDLRVLRYERERVRRRVAAATSGRGYSVAEMAHDLERLATHPVWEESERRAVEDEARREALDG